MKLTDIKRNGNKLTDKQYNTLCDKLTKKLTKAGFKFNVDRVNSSRVASGRPHDWK